jgi:hypothetical protein
MKDASTSTAADRHRQSVSITLAAVSCLLLIAACGSSNNSRNAAASSGYAAFLKFSVCMRSHGLPNFPDPSANGGIKIGPNSGINPQSPALQSAQQTCKKLLPDGGPQQPFSESQRLSIIATSKCMRTHGVPDYPDPTLSATRPRVILSLPATINPQSPAFLTAAKACKGVGDGPPP